MSQDFYFTGQQTFGSTPGLPDTGPKGGGPKTFGQAKTDRLLRAYSAASFTPEGSDQPLFGGAASKLRRRLEGAGVDLSNAPSFTNLAEASTGFSALAGSTNRNKSNIRERVAERTELDLQLKLEEQRQDAITRAQTALDDFMENADFDSFVDAIRNLPESLSDDDVQTLRNDAAFRARTDETARLRRINSSIGIRGLGGSGGAIASLAEQASLGADRQVSDAFTRISLEKLSSDRQDAIAELGLEQNSRITEANIIAGLQNNLQSAISGIPMGNPGAPLQDFSAFIEALNARDIASDMATDEIRNARNIALINAGAQIAPAIIAAAAACWVAAEVFDGWEDVRTHNARYYITYYAPKWFKRLYLKYGERFAEFISNKPLLKRAVKSVFSTFARKGGNYASRRSS